MFQLGLQSHIFPFFVRDAGFQVIRCSLGLVPSSTTSFLVANKFLKLWTERHREQFQNNGNITITHAHPHTRTVLLDIYQMNLSLTWLH